MKNQRIFQIQFQCESILHYRILTIKRSDHHYHVLKLNWTKWFIHFSADWETQRQRSLPKLRISIFYCVNGFIAFHRSTYFEFNRFRWNFIFKICSVCFHLLMNGAAYKTISFIRKGEKIHILLHDEIIPLDSSLKFILHVCKLWCSSGYVDVSHNYLSTSHTRIYSLNSFSCFSKRFILKHPASIHFHQVVNIWAIKCGAA